RWRPSRRTRASGRRAFCPRAARRRPTSIDRAPSAARIRRCNRCARRSGSRVPARGTAVAHGRTPPRTRARDRRRRSSRLRPAHREDQQNRRDDDQHAAPDEVDVDAKRPSVDPTIAQQAVTGEQHAHHDEHQPERNADVELHQSPRDQKNTTLSARIAASTIVPSTAGRSYQTSCASRGFSVSEYTRPASSRSARGAVIRLTRIVTTKQTVHAAIAVQKFCAISLGYDAITLSHPPLTPATAPAGSVRPWCSAAAAVPATRPANAPWPVARFQNMPSRNVASSGAFTNANTSCSTSMMLLNWAATYAVSTDAAMPKTVAMRPIHK